MVDEKRLQLLLDKQDIYELMCRYTRGVDRFDGDLVQSCFWPEAIAVFPLSAHDVFKGKYSDYLKIDIESWKPYTAQQHYICNHLAEVAGDQAIAETYQAWEFVFPRYIASPDFHEFLGRGRGPFLNPAANGIVQGLGLCATLLWWPRLNRPGKLLLMAALPVFAWGVFCTYTRSAWMGAGVGLLVMIGLTTPRGWRAAAVGSIAVGSVLALAGSWEHLVTFKRDTYLSAEDAAESARLRPILAVVAWHMFLDRPLVGCGYGQYIQESPAYLADRTTDLPLEKARPYVQHNVFLALLTETGLVGMGLFIALVTSWTRTAWRLWRGGLAPMWVRQMGLLFVALMGVYLPNAMFQDVSIIPMINMLLFFFAGAIVGLAPRLTAIAPHEHLRVWVPDDELLVVSG